MTFLATGFVDGGRTTGEMLRRMAYAATAGDTGVVRAGDLRVLAGGTPTGAVFVQSGTGFVATRFSDAYAAQSYIVANDAAVAVTVPANTSGATQTRYVIARVTDPQYAGEPTPGDPATALYVVPELVSSLPTTKPYLHLATLTLPNGASSVTQAMIADKREMVNPRRKRDLRALALRSADGTDKLSVTAAAGAVWPTEGSFTVEVPYWATTMRFIATWAQMLVPSTTATVGRLWLRVGNGRADVFDTDYVELNTDSSANNYRAALACLGSVAIPSTMRGASIVMQLRGRKMSGSTAVAMDAATAVSLDLEFVEAPTQDVI